MSPSPKAKMMLALAAAALLAAPLISAQSSAQSLNDDPSSSGTTGLFVVPRAGTLQPGTFSFGAYYSLVAREEGDSNVETLGLSGGFAFGARENLEIFGSFEPRIGIERDFLVEKTLGIPTSEAPHLNDHPFADDGFQSGIGDLRLGVKYRAVEGTNSEYDGLAVAGVIKFPTADDEAGIGTGKFDIAGLVIGSYEVQERVGINGYAGYNFKGDADDVESANEFLYGVGVQAPTRFWIQGIFELVGKSFVAKPDDSDLANVNVLQAGFRITHELGFALDAGVNYNLSFTTPSPLGDLPVREGGGFAKISYSTSRGEPVVFEGVAPQPLPPVNRPPTLSCRAERTSVRQGESVRLFATVNDPDSDTTTVSWSAAAGNITPRQGTTVTWSSAGVQPGAGPIRATVTDGYGGTADCELRVTVNVPPPPAVATELDFSCSEFPSGGARIDNRCKAVLDDVALQLRQNPRATVSITGHSDSVGSDDVNRRMAQQRADNARDYLVQTHGIDASRINTASAGSSRPVGDNSTAAGRAQNRRIEIVVTIPPR